MNNFINIAFNYYFNILRLAINFFKSGLFRIFENFKDSRQTKI